MNYAGWSIRASVVDLFSVAGYTFFDEQVLGDGSPGRIGRSETVMVHLTGPTNRLTGASIIATMDGGVQTAVRMSAAFLSLLRHVFSEWSDADEWLGDAMPRAGSGATAQTTRRGTRVSLSFLDVVRAFMLVIE